MTADALSEKIGTKVNIGSMEIGLFNRVILRDVSIKDKKNEDLLRAKLLTGKISLRSIFISPLTLRSISLLDADINLYKTSKNGPQNFQFLIDAFSSKDKDKPSSLHLRINSLILRRVSVGYHERYIPDTLDKFSPSHIDVKNLDANISLRELSTENIKLRIRHLAFDETKGFRLNNLRFNLSATRTMAGISNFELVTPFSRLSLKYVKLSYDVRKGFDTLLSTLKCEGSVHDWRIATIDVRKFVSFPQEKYFTFSLSTNFNITPSTISLKRLNVSEKNQLFNFLTDITLQRRDKGIAGAAFRLYQLHSRQTFNEQICSLNKCDTTISHIVSRIGDTEIYGEGAYRKNGQSEVLLKLNTDVGKATANALYASHTLNVKFSLLNGHPDVLFAHRDIPQNVSLSGKASLEFINKKVSKAGGNLKISNIDWKGNTYKDITLKSHYEPQHLEAEINSSNNGLNLNVKGETTWVGKKLASLLLKGKINDICPNYLGITTPYGNAVFSGDIDLNLRDINKQNPLGHILLNNFKMRESTRGDYAVDELKATIGLKDSKSHLSVSSDFLQADIVGPLSFEKVKAAGLSLAKRAIPALPIKNTLDSDEEWYLRATLSQPDVIKKMLGADISFSAPLMLEGTFCGGKQRTSITLSGYDISIGNQTLSYPRIYFYGENDAYHCLAQCGRLISGRNYQLAANIYTSGGRLFTNANWNNSEGKSYKGAIESETTFYPSEKNVDFSTAINPTTFLLADTVWNISDGTISFINKNWSFENVSISRPGQSLEVNGHLSPHRNDSITASLKNIDIEYILNLVDFHTVEFGGKASGKAVFSLHKEHPLLRANLFVPSFRFNNAPMGDAHINGSWSPTDNRINLDADMRFPESGDRGTNVKGFVSLRDRNLLLDINANGTKLSCLQKWMNGIFDNFDGEAEGRLLLYGPFKKLDFEGNLTADATAMVAATGVNYRVSQGEVILEPGRFIFNNFLLDDKRGGKGTATGYLQHNHLKNLRYAFTLQTNDLLCYDQGESEDLPFSSKTFGTGNVKMQGYPGNFSADIVLRTNPGTTLTYNLGTQSSQSKDDRMIRFHTYQYADTVKSGLEASAQPSNHTEGKEENSTNINLNFLIQATPDAQVRIITDPRAGDALTVFGEGPIRASYSNKGDFEMYGTYTLTRGNYNISLQDIIRKDLTLQPGSSLTFTGNPLEADLGLKAVYTVNGVSLSDLNYGSNLSQKSVRVDCILNIGGKAKNPQVDFDLDLHNISEDEKQMVRQLISTEEDMNRQVIYLLGVGRFYTANAADGYAQADNSQQSSAAMRSFLSTTLTGQLNNAIASALGSQSNWAFGTNVATGTMGWDDMEVDGLVQGRLFNDRLLINGNFGYRDRPTYTSNFVGDFDVRYLLTPRGNISLKAYSETNDRYFAKSALTTQGVGLTFQKDFNKIGEMFKWLHKRRKKSTSKP